MEYPNYSIQQRHSKDEKEGGSRPMSNLPFLRYTTFATILIAIDSLLSISLWLAGGDSLYLEESVETFSIYTSTFDLACISAGRCVILIVCVYYIEYYTLAAFSTKYEEKQFASRRLSRLCQIAYFLLTLATLIYAIVKGVLIMVVGGQAVYSKLHITYKILCIVAVVNPLIEFVVGVSGVYFMWRLIHVQRLRLILNEPENESQQPRKKADLWRLVKLAKPEYPVIGLGILLLIISNAIQGVTPYFFGMTIDLATRNETLCQEISNGKINLTGDVPHCSLCELIIINIED
jgi:hypothetical protein